MKRILSLMAMAALVGASQVAVAGPGRPPGPPPTFAELDADGNGSVTEEEFAASVTAKTSERFAEIDTDDDGVVTEAEFAAPALEHASEHFTRLDADGDGVITEAEYQAGRRAPRGKH